MSPGHLKAATKAEPRRTRTRALWCVAVSGGGGFETRPYDENSAITRQRGELPVLGEKAGPTEVGRYEGRAAEYRQCIVACDRLGWGGFQTRPCAEGQRYRSEAQRRHGSQTRPALKGSAAGAKRNAETGVKPAPTRKIARRMSGAGIRRDPSVGARRLCLGLRGCRRRPGRLEGAVVGARGEAGRDSRRHSYRDRGVPKLFALQEVELRVRLRRAGHCQEQDRQCNRRPDGFKFHVWPPFLLSPFRVFAVALGSFATKSTQRATEPRRETADISRDAAVERLKKPIENSVWNNRQRQLPKER
jgi:hypothetical protein